MSTPLFVTTSMSAGGFEQVQGFALPPTLPEAPATSWPETSTTSLSGGSIAYDPSSGSVYVFGLHSTGGLVNRITKFTSAGVSSIFVANAGSINHIACDSAGNVYCGVNAGGKIVYYDPTGAGPFNYIVNAAIISHAGAGGGGAFPGLMVFDATNNLWVLQGDGSCLQIAPGGGSLVVRATAGALTAPYVAGGNPCIDAAGNIYVSILKYINKITPCMTQTFFTDLGIVTSGNIYSVAYDPSSAKLISHIQAVGGGPHSSIYSIDPATAVKTLLNNNTAAINSIASMIGPFAVATVPACVPPSDRLMVARALYHLRMFTITGVSQAQIDKLVAGLRSDPDTSLTEPSPGSFQIVGHGVTAVASFSGDVLSVNIAKKPWAYPMSAVVSRVEAAIKEELAK